MDKPNGQCVNGKGTPYLDDSIESSCEEREREEHRYGWFCFAPSWLQGLARGIWVCIFLTIANTLISGTYNGLSGSAQTSIETRFGLSSTQSSWIMTSYEIGNVVGGLTVAILGSSQTCHRPRWIACGLLIAVLGCIVYSLPHFITGVYEPEEALISQDITCSMKPNETDFCDTDDSENRNPDNAEFVGLFIVARILLSFGAAPLHIQGIAYMDDSGSKEKFSFYSGIFCCGWILGPALGFICGGYALTIFTDFYSVDESEWIDKDDPRWVGAWWIGFLFAGAIMLLFAAPMAGFPKDLPGAHEMRLKKTSEAYEWVQNENEVSAAKNEDFDSKDLGPYLKYLFTNWTYLCLNCFIACDVGIMAGYTVFGPKVLEVLYNLTSAQASGLMGILVVPSALIGTISGGVIVRKFSLSIVGIMKVQLFLSFVVIVGGLCNLIYCPDADFAGVNIPYPDQESEDVEGENFNLTSNCNMYCDCDQVPFSPVCSYDNIQYYSPCHAGCYGEINDHTVYENCSCVAYQNTSVSSSAEEGICTTSSCSAVIGFCALMFLVMVAIFMTAAMNISGVVRSVPRTHRLLGLVINGIMQKIIGTIPAPVIFGIIFDSSCILWEEECDGQGSCYYFDKVKLGLYLYLTCLVYKVISVIFLLLAWKLYKPPRAAEPIEIKVNDNIAAGKTTYIAFVGNDGSNSGQQKSGVNVPFDGSNPAYNISLNSSPSNGLANNDTDVVNTHL